MGEGKKTDVEVFKKGENRGNYITGVLSAALLFGLAPQTYLIWLSWRIVSAFLPSSVYQRGTDAIFSLYQRLVLFVIEHVMGSQLILYGDVDAILKKKDRALYLANHQSYVDWVIAEALGIRNGNLHKVRYVMKDSIQFVPLYGHFLYEHGCIYVNRESFNQAGMVKILQNLKKQSLPSWMVVYPEGTRYDPASLKLIEISNKRAKEQGLQQFEHVLTPRPKGVNMILDEIKDQFDAVYDITMAYEGSIDPQNGQKKSAPNMIEFLSARRRRIHIYIRRIEIKDMPTSQMEIREWINNIFINKEQLLDSFYKDNGSKWRSNQVFGEGVLSPPNLWSTFPVFFLSSTLFISLLMTGVGRGLYWRTWVFGSLGSYVWLAASKLLA